MGIYHHGLVESVAYLIGVALVLPLLDHLHDVFPLVAIVLSVLVLAPLPIWAYQLRYELPAWLETGLIWHAITLWGCLLVCLIGAVAMGVYRWTC